MNKLKELICFFFGHKWDSKFDPKQELKKPIKDRTFCKRCGIKYHQHQYQTKNN